ncbi:peptide/nickel transport system substrate-binding protein [Microbacterium resistens]|uniref:Peptide/nickel transport system substrate-binding protein n=1 Tax=Microbacterium resistens TaxID=156977 RepID=A0ABU1SHC8_9MICO|nr:ABC transporter substrate-binding protein [Microbacterium resistens]MDR6868373.1 peptide/nickel transport system substrate-binding protein [Microbacterium resistens]
MARRHRIATVLSIVAATGLALTACAPATGDAAGTAASAGTTGSSFTYVIASDPSSTNPINASDRWGLTFSNIVYSPLARVEGDGKVVNELAESIEPAADGLSVTVTLKDGLKWSDGEPLTADDVVFTYTNKAIRENGNADLLYVGDKPITAEATDARTVVFHLPSVSAAAISNIATETYIIPKHVYGAVTDFSVTALDPAAVGSGPYRLTEYKRGEYLRFEPNPNYYGDAPNIKDLTLRIVSNADTVKTALQTGEVDASFVTPAQVEEFAGTDVTTYPYAEGRVAYLGVNAAKVPDVNVRKALFTSLDRAQIGDGAFLSPDYYAEAYSILPPSNPFATADVEKYDTDVDAAKKLLAGATPALTLGYSANDPAQQTEATLIQEQAAKAGITVELQAVDPNALTPEVQKGKDSQFDLFLGGYIMGNDPDAYSALFRTGASANYFSYSNPAVDALFDKGAAELDKNARTATYAELQQKIAEDAVFYPIADNKKILAVNKRITGVEDATPVPIYTLENFGKLKVQ